MSQTSTLPLLGDDGKPPLPTMRDVARSFKEAGLDGLPSAVQRADHASYQEVRCRSALNRVQGMPFKWTLNPYRGCTHGCHYCFARRYQSQLEMGAGDDFSSVILVKVNFPEVLRRELVRGTAVRDLVALGTATDPYQPAEGHYRLTRRSLQALVDHPTPVALVTKGPLVVRDIDPRRAVTPRAEHGQCQRADSTRPPGSGWSRERHTRSSAPRGETCGSRRGCARHRSCPGSPLIQPSSSRRPLPITGHLDGGTRMHFSSSSLASTPIWSKDTDVSMPVNTHPRTTRRASHRYSVHSRDMGS